jgi:hypothetical protein
MKKNENEDTRMKIEKYQKLEEETVKVAEIVFCTIIAFIVCTIGFRSMGMFSVTLLLVAFFFILSIIFSYCERKLEKLLEELELKEVKNDD